MCTLYVLMIYCSISRIAFALCIRNCCICIILCVYLYIILCVYLYIILCVYLYIILCVFIYNIMCVFIYNIMCVCIHIDVRMWCVEVLCVLFTC